jgi:predicted RNA-binding protein Jag
MVKPSTLIVALAASAVFAASGAMAQEEAVDTPLAAAAAEVQAAGEPMLQQAAVDAELEAMRRDLELLSDIGPRNSFSLSLTVDGATTDVAAREGQSYAQIAVDFVNGIKGLAEDEATAIKAAHAIALSLRERSNELFAQEQAAAAAAEPASEGPRVINAIELTVDGRQVPLALMEGQSPERAALLFAVRENLNRNTDIDLILRRIVARLSEGLEGVQPTRVVGPEGADAFFPVTIDLTTPEGGEGSQTYNLYIARGESVAEAVEGFVRRLDLTRDDATLEALSRAAETALQTAQEERQLKSGAAGPDAEAERLAANGNRGGVDGAAGRGDAGSAGDAGGAGGPSAALVRVPVMVMDTEYVLEVGLDEDPAAAAEGVFSNIAARQGNEAMQALFENDRAEAVQIIARIIAAAIAEASASAAAAAPPALESAGSLLEVAPFDTEVSILIGPNAANVDIKQGMALPDVAAYLCENERERYLADLAAVQAGTPGPEGAAQYSQQLAALFASEDGVASPLCRSLVLDVLRNTIAEQQALREQK